jgi:signal transduction histidine kinase
VLPASAVFFMGVRKAIGVLAIAFLQPILAFLLLFIFPFSKISQINAKEIVMLVNIIFSMGILTLMTYLFEYGRMNWKKMVLVQFKELNQATKLATLGELAGNIAHEINNPLSIISASAQRIEKEIQKDQVGPEKVTQLSGKIRHMVSRVRNITRTLLSLSDSNFDSTQVEKVVVSDLIDTVSSICNYKFRENGIQFEVNFNHKSMVFHGSKNGIAQVLVNSSSLCYHQRV